MALSTVLLATTALSIVTNTVPTVQVSGACSGAFLHESFNKDQNIQMPVPNPVLEMTGLELSLDTVNLLPIEGSPNVLVQLINPASTISVDIVTGKERLPQKLAVVRDGATLEYRGALLDKSGKPLRYTAGRYQGKEAILNLTVSASAWMGALSKIELEVTSHMGVSFDDLSSLGLTGFAEDYVWAYPTCSFQ